MATIVLAALPVRRAAAEPVTAASAPAQGEGARAAKASTTLEDPTGARLRRMLHAEQYDEIVADTTALLTQSPSAEVTYFAHYYRGCAEWRLGSLEGAQADMTAITASESSHPERYPSPHGFLEIIARQKALLPPVRREVRIDGTPYFTVYADSEDVAEQELLELLPVAVASVRRIVAPRETVVILFGSVEKMQAYEDIPRRTSPIDPAVLAHGGYEGVHICLSHQPGKYVTDPRGGYFRLSVTHEYLHVMVDRVLEAHARLPQWFSEGLANVAGLHSAPSEEATFATRLKTAVDHHALLPLSEIDGRKFYRIANETFAGTRSEDPYAQATEMTEYLLLGRPESIAAELLQAVRRTNDFPKAFAEIFGESVDEFYADWHAYAVR